jgi:hypothetical protein
LNESGARSSDQKIDFNESNIISLSDGGIVLPTFTPFAADTIPVETKHRVLKGACGEGKMYSVPNVPQINNDSRFTIEVDYANQSATINLGFMIVEGSERFIKAVFR